jgi:hypothetical protein
MSRHSIPIQTAHVGFGASNGTAVISPLINKQIKLFSISLVNRSGSPSDIAVLKGIAVSQFKVFTYSGSSASDVTSTIQGGSNINVCTTSSGSGLIIQSTKKFGFIALNINTAQTGSPTIAYQFWNGSAFASATGISVPTSFGSGNNVIYLTQDYLMGVGANSFDSSLDSSMYTIRISVASSGNTPTANSIVVGSTVDFMPQIPNNSSFTSSFSEDYPLTLDGNEKLIPYFSSVNSNNLVSLFYAQDN